jgi:hypothetical protein
LARYGGNTEKGVDICVGFVDYPLASRGKNRARVTEGQAQGFSSQVSVSVAVGRLGKMPWQEVALRVVSG